MARRGACRASPRNVHDACARMYIKYMDFGVCAFSARSGNIIIHLLPSSFFSLYIYTCWCDWCLFIMGCSSGRPTGPVCSVGPSVRLLCLPFAHFGVELYICNAGTPIASTDSVKVQALAYREHDRARVHRTYILCTCRCRQRQGLMVIRRGTVRREREGEREPRQSTGSQQPVRRIGIFKI